MLKVSGVFPVSLKLGQFEFHGYLAGLAVHLNFLAFHANVFPCAHFEQTGQKL